VRPTARRGDFNCRYCLGGVRRTKWDARHTLAAAQNDSLLRRAIQRAAADTD